MAKKSKSYWEIVGKSVKNDINRMLTKGYTRRQLKESGFIEKAKRQAISKENKRLFGFDPMISFLPQQRKGK